MCAMFCTEAIHVASVAVFRIVWETNQIFLHVVVGKNYSVLISYSASCTQIKLTRYYLVFQTNNRWSNKRQQTSSIKQK